MPSQHIEPGWATVTDVDHDKGIVTLVRDDGRAIRFQPSKLQSNRSENALRIGREREVQLHEGEKIRWTDTDRARGIYNADNAKILSITNKGVTIENATGLKLLLPHGDPMLSRLDLGYAMNTHQLQGATADRAIAIGEARETNLANGRLFLVNITRARDSLEVIVDDAERFARALDCNLGDKSSALDTSGGTSANRRQPNPGTDALLPRVEVMTYAADAAVPYRKPNDRSLQTMAPVPVKQLDLDL